MIDSLSIILSTLACLYVVYRAVQLDRILPWFGAPAARPPSEAKPAWQPPWAGPEAEPASDASPRPPVWTPHWS